MIHSFLQAAKIKGNEDLSLWAGSVRNHFWYCSKNCEDNIADFKVRMTLVLLWCVIAICKLLDQSSRRIQQHYSRMQLKTFYQQDLWRGVLHHVVDEHEWVLGQGKSNGKCSHEPLTEEERKKPWLKKTSAAHKALRKIALDKRFLGTIPYYTRFRFVYTKTQQVFCRSGSLINDCLKLFLQTHRLSRVLSQPSPNVLSQTQFLQVFASLLKFYFNSIYVT